MTEGVCSAPTLFAENVEACAKCSSRIHKMKEQPCDSGSILCT